MDMNRRWVNGWTRYGKRSEQTVKSLSKKSCFDIDRFLLKEETIRTFSPDREAFAQGVVKYDRKELSRGGQRPSSSRGKPRILKV